MQYSFRDCSKNEKEDFIFLPITSVAMRFTTVILRSRFLLLVSDPAFRILGSGFDIFKAIDLDI